MAEPQRVAESIVAMRKAVGVPVTVKCRIGIDAGTTGRAVDDPIQDYEFLCRFVRAVVDAGCDALILHARKAILSGLSPKQNREIPPLRYDVAAQLRRDFPGLTLVVNGGIRTDEQVRDHLDNFHGVMLGREICDNPYRLAELHRLVCEPQWQPERNDVVASYREYAKARLAEGHRLAPILRHALTLYAGQPRARSWRRYISERAGLDGASPDILHDALRIVA